MDDGRSPVVSACLLALALTLVSACAQAPSDASTTDPQASVEDRGRGFGEMSDLAGSRTDKGPGEHHFTELYEHILHPLRNEPIRILEIGVAEGGSLALWQDYFPRARIFGLDIQDRSMFDNERVTTFVADQADRNALEAFLELHGGEFDFILDDGGHKMHQQQISLGLLFPHVKPGGYYILEDVHTSLPEYWRGYNVEPGEQNSTLTMIERYMRTAVLTSQYMSRSEQRYLTENIEYCLLFFRNTRYHSMAAVFQKKQR